VEPDSPEGLHSGRRSNLRYIISNADSTWCVVDILAVDSAEKNTSGN
jgi:hypothetical protein